MAIMDMFKKKKEIDLPIPSPPAMGPAAFRRTEPMPLPSELDQFRMQPVTTPSYSPPPEPVFTPAPSVTPTDKTDLILSKLETIDARLRIIEERLERRSSQSPIF